jgi:hypothetical protein
MVITNTPKKLNMVAIITAARGVMERVDMHVAMAFGASVQPLTIITPIVSREVTSNVGIVNSSCKNSQSEIVILHVLSEL